MKTIKGLFCLALIAFAVIWGASCKPSDSTENQENAEQSDGATPEERRLDKEAFAAAIQQPGAIVVDLRHPVEFERGHIDGAINIYFFDPQFKNNLLDLNRKKKYYLYEKNERTPYRAMEFMRENDFKQVYILNIGYDEWITK